MVVFVPSQTKLANANPPRLTRANLWSFPHVLLDPSQGGNAQLDIDFNYFKGFLDLVEGDSLGQLYVVVHNQLKAATGSQNFVVIKFFMQILGAEFKIPRSGGNSFRSYLNLPIVEPHSAMGKITEELGNVLNTITPSNVVGDILSILDKPQIPAPPDQVSVKYRGTMNNGAGPEQVDKFQLYPSKQQFCDMEHFNMKTDLLLSHHFKEKLSYVTSLNWTSTANPGDILYSTKVGPMANINPDPGQLLDINEFDYFNVGFENWRGGIMYVIEVVTSQFHEGRLDITYHPNESPAPTDYNAGMSQYAASMFIRSSDNLIFVKCPYLADKPWRHIHNGRPLATIPADHVFRFQDNFSGTMAIRVGASLRAPTTVVPNVDINIYMCGANDYEVCNLSWNNRSITLDPTPFVELHSANDVYNINMSPAQQVFQSLAPADCNTFDGVTPHFGEKFESIQEILKRYGKHTQIPFSSTDNGLANVYFSLNDLFFFPDKRNLFHNRYLQCFRNFRGPMCLKLKLTCAHVGDRDLINAGDVWVSWQPNPPRAPSNYTIERVFGHDTGVPKITQTAIPMAYFDERQQAEIEIPFIHLSQTALIINEIIDRSVNDGNSSDYLGGQFIIAWQHPAEVDAASCSIDISFAFGDETQIGTWIGIPKIRMSVDGSGNSPFPDFWNGHFLSRTEDKVAIQNTPMLPERIQSPRPSVTVQRR
jgi:hypothetical protein